MLLNVIIIQILLGDDNDSKGDKPKLSDAQEKILVKEGTS